MNHPRKTVLIVGDKNPLSDWYKYEKVFNKNGWNTIILFYYWNYDEESQEIVDQYRKRFVFCQPPKLKKPKDEDIALIEKKLNSTSVKSFTFTEAFLYRKKTSEVLCETKKIVDDIEGVLQKEQIDLVVQGQGAGLLRRVVYSLTTQRNIPNIYLGISWFKNRMFLHENEMNIVSEYVPVMKIQKQMYQFIESYADNAIQKKEVYKYRFKEKNDISEINGKKILKSTWAKMKHKSVYKSFILKKKRVSKSFRQFKNKAINTGFLYRNVLPNKPFFYFPMHYTRDSQITLREQNFLRQETVIEYIANNLPYGTILLVKPHPHAQGEYAVKEMLFLVRNENIQLLTPKFSTHNILKNKDCLGTIIINSSAGFESLLYKRPVISIGTFYGIYYPKVIVNSDLKSISAYLKEIMMQMKSGEIPKQEYIKALASIYEATYPGSVYTKNIDYEVVVNSILDKYKNINQQYAARG